MPVIPQGWLRVVIFCIAFFLVFIMAGTVYGWITEEAELSGQGSLLLGFIISFIFSMLVVYVFRTGVDARSFTSLGFQFKGHKRDAIIGLLLGIGLLCIESLILYLTGHLEWTGWQLDAPDLLYGLVIMILVAISEEAVFRGYILHNLMQSMNRWIALIITSLLFALFHAGNPNITILALLNIFLSGLLMGVNYLYTRNLWFAILFHFSWNFFLGPILGYEVSGLPLDSLLQQSIHGPEWLTGGEFGLEGSVLDGIFSVVALVAYQLRAANYERRATAASDKL